MRWRLIVGFGFAGAVAGSALGQFAVDRVPQQQPATPGLPSSGQQSPLPSGFQPVAPNSTGAYTPPVGGVMPTGFNAVNPGGAAGYPSYPSLSAMNSGRTPSLTTSPRVEIESALGPNHPWALKPEHGMYLICVKSYSRPHTPTPEDNGPSARALAEALATEVRNVNHRQALLYEYVSDERKAEASAIAAERERGQAFMRQLNEHRQQAELQGMEFLEPDNRIRFKTVSYRDQIAVMVGGFQSDIDARKALDEMRKWAPPKDTMLMDGVVSGRPAGDGTGKVRIEKGYLNPYLSATVVMNPLLRHESQPVSNHLDPFVVKLNDGRPYNLLKATKEWTLAVKSFNAPVEIVSSKDPDTKMRKDDVKKAGNALVAGMAQAEMLAKVLREMKSPSGQSLGLEAFVLHTRTSSIVTVGQFDGPNDPALVQIQNLLTGMKMNISQDKMGNQPVANAPSLFENRLVPIPIPRP